MATPSLFPFFMEAGTGGGGPTGIALVSQSEVVLGNLDLIAVLADNARIVALPEDLTAVITDQVFTSELSEDTIDVQLEEAVVAIEVCK